VVSVNRAPARLTENPCEFNRWMQHHLIEIILFLEVVFMRPGRRYGLSTVQKTVKQSAGGETMRGTQRGSWPPAGKDVPGRIFESTV
jgi:hypothetical protein